MTASDLLADPEFIGFCVCWERDGRCPLPFSDALRDRGLDGQADAAAWAAAEPDRDGADDDGGIRPSRAYGADGSYGWFSRPRQDPVDGVYWRDNIPADVFAELVRDRPASRNRFPTFALAVAAFLDAWAAARVPKCERCGGDGLECVRPNGEGVDCPACEGTGKTTEARQ